MIPKICGLHGLTEDSPHQYVIKASTLGLEPGEWPGQLRVTNDERVVGNGLLFIRSEVERSNSKLVKVRYIQELGCVMIDVLND